MKKFCFTVILCCFFWFSGPASAELVLVLPEPPPNAEIGRQYINSGSGVLCTLKSEKRLGNFFTFWARDEIREASIECLPANTGTPPQILFYDPPETIQILHDNGNIYRTFQVAFPDAVFIPDLDYYPQMIKMYIVDTKTLKLFKTEEYFAISPAYFNSLEGLIIYEAGIGLTIQMRFNRALKKPYPAARSLDLRVTGSGIYDFVIEAIDINNNSSFAAVPINIEYIGD